MKKSVKKKWLTALRSGKYKQTTGALKDDNGYCCLGVLCDLYRKEKKKKLWKKFNGRVWMFYSFAVLPNQVAKWAGLDFDLLKVKKMQDKLMSMNDMDGCSFKQIAEVIEKRL